MHQTVHHPLNELHMMQDMKLSKPPRSSTTKSKLLWPFKARSQDVPVCIKPSAFDMRPPWRPFNPKSAAFEPRSRLLSADEWAPQKTMRVCRHELFLQRTMRPASAASSNEKKETLHCDCLSHWNKSRPSSAPAGGPGSKQDRPKKRPVWRPGSAKSAAFDSDHGLLCDPGTVIRPPNPCSAKDRMLCKTCGLRAKNLPLLRNLAIKIDNLMSESPFGWCVTNP